MPSLMRNFFLNVLTPIQKKHKLYNILLDKISPKTKLLISDPSRKDGPALVSILHTLISDIQSLNSSFFV